MEDDTHTSLDLIRDYPNLLAGSVQLGLDLTTEGILHQAPSSGWYFQGSSEKKAYLQVHTEKVFRPILDTVLDL